MNRSLSILLTSFFALMALSKSAKAQEQGQIMLAHVVNGDTFPMRQLPYTNVVEEKVFKSKREKAKWARLKKKVKEVYPYAKLAGDLLDKYAAEMDTVSSERARKKYYKMIEDELKAEFEGTIREMTTSEGRILVKLIDRETSHTSYEIVKEFRGGITAFFWQGIGKMFGQDLKSNYDPKGEDAEIEQIVLMIEAGLI